MEYSMEAITALQNQADLHCKCKRWNPQMCHGLYLNYLEKISQTWWSSIRSILQQAVVVCVWTYNFNIYNIDFIDYNNSEDAWDAVLRDEVDGTFKLSCIFWKIL